MQVTLYPLGLLALAGYPLPSRPWRFYALGFIYHLPLSLSLSLYMYISTYLPTYLSDIYLPTYLPTYLSLPPPLPACQSKARAPDQALLPLPLTHLPQLLSFAQMPTPPSLVPDSLVVLLRW